MVSGEHGGIIAILGDRVVVNNALHNNHVALSTAAPRNVVHVYDDKQEEEEEEEEGGEVQEEEEEEGEGRGASTAAGLSGSRRGVSGHRATEALKH